jgi:peptidoglycan hydrolase-like protein with peptidoglycan-binding domain
MILPVSEMKYPSAIGYLTNGYINKDDLVTFGPDGSLISPAARAFQALRFHCLGFGLKVCWTYGGTYRDFDTQRRTFEQRYESVSLVVWLVTPKDRRKTWPDARQYKHRSTHFRKRQSPNGTYPATAATPGNSDHGWAVAVDIAEGDHPRRVRAINTDKGKFALLVRDAESFGFSWQLQSEPWHIQYFAGDAIPQRVLDVEAFIAAMGAGLPAPPPPPPPFPPPVPVSPVGPFSEVPVSLPMIRQGASGFYVRLLQATLVAHGHDLPVDGGFGKITNDHVLWFQSTKGLTADGVVGPVTWARLMAPA